MLSLPFLIVPSTTAFHSKHPLLVISPVSRASPWLCSCSLRSHKASLTESLTAECKGNVSPVAGERFVSENDAGGEGISGIFVPRQGYISVPKPELLGAILSLFESKEDADEFVSLSTCLDSILHAEHKGILEEMRTYYSLRGDAESMLGKQCFSGDGSVGVGKRVVNRRRNDAAEEPLRSTEAKKLESRLAAEFQQAFMKLLRDAQFEELSAEDLLLTYALNSDYLLTLPIYVDWKRASESNAIIFRRGYATERQQGLLIVEKLDFLQSKLLQEIFFSLSRPLEKIGSWISEALKSSNGAVDLQVWIDKVKLWLIEQYSLERTQSIVESSSKTQTESNQIAAGDLPIWLAAQKAVLRYEGVLSSVGPRGRLIRKFLSWMGIIPSMPKESFDLMKGISSSETYSRPIFLPRITLSNIWEPATREFCGNNIWMMIKSSISIFFSQSTLQEPAFQELILLYTEETSKNGDEGMLEVLPLQLKIYEKIPIPDLPVIFPHKKLSFRILDTVRLDVASILGLLAFFVNYKFENIVTSPSAVFLDVIAVSALIIYVTRVALGYKQTWDRYQLLVNKTLYEKTLASGFGSVYFLLDASEQQQYKEAILVYVLLLHSEKDQVSCLKSVKDACERFIYAKFNLKIEMPIDKAMDTLLRLGLVTEFQQQGDIRLKALRCSVALEELKRYWDDMLEQK